MVRQTVTADNLDSVMEFDHVIEVHADGTVTDSTDSPYFAVSYYLTDLESDTWELQTELPAGWELMSGYTGQYSYNGPVMHTSEFIGGRMARDILETPGLYVALAVESDCNYTAEFCNEESGCECEPDGWVVARKIA